MAHICLLGLCPFINRVLHRTEHQFTAPNDGRIGGIGNRNKVEEMLKKMKMGKNSRECFTEMSKDGKIQDGLRSEIV